MEPDVNNEIYLALIEDNTFIRKGWEAVLSAEDDFKVISSSGSCEDAFLNETDPGKADIFKEVDIVIMDIGLPGISGIEGVKYLKQKYPGILIIMCTVHDEDDKVFDAVYAGAVGYLLKKTTPAELIKALHEAYRGGSPMTPSIARKIISSFQQLPQTKAELTEREHKILSFMAQGLTYSAIAENMFLSVDGVYYHIRHIYEKLHVHSRAEAVAQGFKQRIIRTPK